MTVVKICGLMRVEDALVAADAGADMIGFVFAPSRRKIEPERAAAIIETVRRQAPIKTVGIFVNESPATMNHIAELTGLDYVQLSGDEPDEMLTELSRPAIKTLHIAESDDTDNLMHRFSASSAPILHLDTGHAAAYGGTGTPFDWSVLPVLQRTSLLAGGLHAGNVQRAIRQVNPWGVDVSSGVETDGVKDRDKIREFIRCANEVSAEETTHP